MYSSWSEVAKKAKMQSKSKEEIKNEICRKHGVGNYYYGSYGSTNYPYMIDEEAKGLSNSLWKGIQDKIEIHTRTTVNSSAKNQVKYDIRSYESKIRQTPQVFDNFNKLKTTLNDYIKELGNIRVQIANAPDMQEADKIAVQLKEYHDLNVESLRHQSSEVIKDFGLSLLGIEPVINEGYESP